MKNYLKKLISRLLFSNKEMFDWQDAEETLMSCIGKNYLFGNLTDVGIFVFYLTEIIGQDYTLKSIIKTKDDEEQGLNYEFWSDFCIDIVGHNPINKETYEKSRDTGTHKNIPGGTIGN